MSSVANASLSASALASSSGLLSLRHMHHQSTIQITINLPSMLPAPVPAMAGAAGPMSVNVTMAPTGSASTATTTMTKATMTADSSAASKSQSPGLQSAESQSPKSQPMPSQSISSQQPESSSMPSQSMSSQQPESSSMPSQSMSSQQPESSSSSLQPPTPSQPIESTTAPAEANTQAQPQPQVVQQKPLPAEADPARGPFPGGVPKPTSDVPITAIFMALFGLGAFTHNAIYRANAKRGHKFLLSELMVDFCIVRVLTCIFRIVWAFRQNLRGVVLVALIFQYGGAVVVYIVNLFLAQRLVRAMQPAIGWHPAFSYKTIALALSVPAVTVLNIVTISVSFFSVNKLDRLQTLERILIFGASWSLMLVMMPLFWLFAATALPRPSRFPPEEFGTGDQARKACLLVVGAILVTVPAAIKLAGLANPMSVATSPLFNRGAFYGLGFLLEILVVAAYAYFRIDQLFHVPNGASGPGDYSAAATEEVKRRRGRMARHDVEEMIGKIGVRCDIISSNQRYPVNRRGGGGDDKQGPLIAVFYLDEEAAEPEMFPTRLPPREIRRISRREVISQALTPQRPQRALRSSDYQVEK